MREEDAIVTSLKDIQDALGEKDASFAARLGVTRSAWTQVRLGGKRPGRKLLGGARIAFPKLERQIVEFLVSENVTNTTDNG